MDAYLVLPDSEVDTLCRLDTHESLIALTYSSKIPLRDTKFIIGGNGANVSVGAKKMGVETRLVAEIGTGHMANAVKEILNKATDATYVTQTEGVSEGFGAVVMYQGERTILSYYDPEEPVFPLNLETSEWAYLTSTSEKFDNYYNGVLEWLRKSDARLGFNPGGRQIKKGVLWLKPYLELTELLLVNRNEAEEVTNFGESHKKEKDLLKALIALGPKKAVITDGPNGAYAWDGQKYLYLGILPIKSKERTGAGDAFSVGCISALINGKSLGEGMVWGMCNSSSVIQYFGPQEGQLTSGQLPEWIKKVEVANIKLEEI